MDPFTLSEQKETKYMLIFCLKYKLVNINLFKIFIVLKQNHTCYDHLQMNSALKQPVNSCINLLFINNTATDWIYK